MAKARQWFIGSGRAPPLALSKLRTANGRHALDDMVEVIWGSVSGNDAEASPCTSMYLERCKTMKPQFHKVKIVTHGRT